MLSLLVTMTLAAVTMVIAPQPPVIMVDGIAGQRLEGALLQVQKPPGATSRIKGTYVGEFLRTTNGVRLESASL